MTRSGLGQVARWVRQFWGTKAYQDLSDCELLQKYVRDRDEEAFATILRRHGPWVLRLCRRVLGSDADAEDAFQATWLVLARKAASLRACGILSNWLHGVAYKTSLKARALAWRRLQHEQQAMTRHEATDKAGANERLPEWVEEELERLPAKLRNPILLCYYEGKTREEAARELRCTPGAIKSSLERGKEMLRKRLARRGLACSPAVLAVCFAESSSAAVSPALMAATLHTIFAGAASAQVVLLARGVLSALLWNKLKNVAAILVLGLGLAGAGWGWHVSQSRESDGADLVGLTAAPSAAPSPGLSAPRQEQAPAPSATKPQLLAPPLMARPPRPDEPPHAIHGPPAPPEPNEVRPFFSATISVTSTVIVISGDGVFCFRVHPQRGPECIGPISVWEDLED